MVPGSRSAVGNRGRRCVRSSAPDGREAISLASKLMRYGETPISKVCEALGVSYATPYRYLELDASPGVGRGTGHHKKTMCGCGTAGRLETRAVARNACAPTVRRANIRVPKVRGHSIRRRKVSLRFGPPRQGVP